MVLALAEWPIMSAFFGSSYICFVYTWKVYWAQRSYFEHWHNHIGAKRKEGKKKLLGSKKKKKKIEKQIYSIYLTAATHQLQELEDSGRRL
jgi:hypothetical protein